MRFRKAGPGPATTHYRRLPRGASNRPFASEPPRPSAVAATDDRPQAGGSSYPQPAPARWKPPQPTGQTLGPKRCRTRPHLNNRPLFVLLVLALLVPPAAAIAPIVPAMLISASIHGGVLTFIGLSSDETDKESVQTVEDPGTFDNIGASKEETTDYVYSSSWGEGSTASASCGAETYHSPDSGECGGWDLGYGCCEDDFTGDKGSVTRGEETTLSCPGASVEKQGECVPPEIDLPETSEHGQLFLRPDSGEAKRATSDGTVATIEPQDGPLKKKIDEDTSGNPVTESGAIFEPNHADGTFSVIEYQQNIDSVGTDTARETKFDSNNNIVSQKEFDSYTSPDYDGLTRNGEEWQSSGEPDQDTSTDLGDATDDTSTIDSDTGDPQEIEVEEPGTPYSGDDPTGETGISDLETGIGDVPGAPATDGLGNSFDGVRQVGTCEPVTQEVFGRTVSLDYCTSAGYIRTILAWIFALLTAMSIYSDWFRRPA